MKYCSAASKVHEGRVVHSEFADCPYLTRFLSSILREHDLHLAEFTRVCVKIFLKFCEVLNCLLSFIFPNPELSCCAISLCAAQRMHQECFQEITSALLSYRDTIAFPLKRIGAFWGATLVAQTLYNATWRHGTFAISSRLFS